MLLFQPFSKRQSGGGTLSVRRIFRKRIIFPKPIKGSGSFVAAGQFPLHLLTLPLTRAFFTTLPIGQCVKHCSEGGGMFGKEELVGNPIVVAPLKLRSAEDTTRDFTLSLPAFAMLDLMISDADFPLISLAQLRTASKRCPRSAVGKSCQSSKSTKVCKAAALISFATSQFAR